MEMAKCVACLLGPRALPAHFLAPNFWASIKPEVRLSAKLGESSWRASLRSGSLPTGFPNGPKEAPNGRQSEGRCKSVDNDGLGAAANEPNWATVPRGARSEAKEREECATS